jgi:ketosteroid isomerase-like protein
MTMSTRQRFDQIAHYFETLTPEGVSALNSFYSASARFKDPFNDVTGVPAIEKIFAHMYVSLAQPRFVITGQVVDGDQAFLTWEFRFRFKRFDTQTEQVVLGTSHLVLDAQQRISLHRDYWDAAEELYEKLPGVGALMRWLKKRANS